MTTHFGYIGLTGLQACCGVPSAGSQLDRDWRNTTCGNCRRSALWRNHRDVDDEEAEQLKRTAVRLQTALAEVVNALNKLVDRPWVLSLDLEPSMRIDVTLVPHGYQVDVRDFENKHQGRPTSMSTCRDFAGNHSTAEMARLISARLIDMFDKLEERNVGPTEV